MRIGLPLAAAIAFAPSLTTTGGHAMSVQSTYVSSGTSALLRVAYYLNDKEQDASRHCRLYFLNGTDLVAPTLVEGFKHWYQKPKGAYEKSEQRILLKCDEYVIYSEAHYDLFEGNTAIVLDAYSKASVLLGNDRYSHFPIDSGPHHLIWTGHGEGRFALQEQWRRLPPVLQKALKGTYCLTMLDGKGRIFFDFHFR